MPQLMGTIAECADVCEFNFLMVCAIFSGGARVHWLILFNSFLAKQLNIACSINTKLFTYCALAHRFVQPKLAYIRVRLRKFCRSKNKAAL